MIKTDFSTHCSRNAWPDWVRLVFGALVLALAALIAAPHARAAAQTPEISQLTLERQSDGVYLSANIDFNLPPVVEDALLKGIPMIFVAEVEIKRTRWYWYDRKVSSTARHMRLAYQPLTRRWRLNVAPEAMGANGNSSLSLTLNQTFDTLAEVLGTIKRISNWKVAELADIDQDSRNMVEFRFYLDQSQLPRPFQIGLVGQSDWVITVVKTQQLTVENAR